MPEFVALPIFDEDGRETGRLLKIDTRHFLGAAGSETAHKYIQVVNKNAFYEVEMLDRIVSGLAPRRDFRESNKRALIENMTLHNAAVVKGDVGMGTIETLAANSHESGTFIESQPSWWRTIPGFSQYQMSNYKAIAQDGKTVSIVKGISNKRRLDNVLLTNDDGIVKRMSVAFLFEQTFPELA